MSIRCSKLNPDAEEYEAYMMAMEEDQNIAVTNKGAIYYDPEQMRFDAEEYESCMMAMDDYGVPRNVKNDTLSIWGRALWMAQNQARSKAKR